MPDEAGALTFTEVVQKLNSEIKMKEFKEKPRPVSLLIKKHTDGELNKIIQMKD